MAQQFAGVCLTAGVDCPGVRPDCICSTLCRVVTCIVEKDILQGAVTIQVVWRKVKSLFQKGVAGLNNESRCARFGVLRHSVVCRGVVSGLLANLYRTGHNIFRIKLA